jgi:heme/copper-type cytochrome/quinol oxidase subunit 4
MPFHFENINWLAVLAAAVINFFVGAIWYTALFGKLWIKLNGYSEQQVKEMQAKMSPPRFFGGMILSQIVLALAVAFVLTSFAEPNLQTSVLVGLAFWLVSAAISMTNHLASDKPDALYVLNVACHLIYLLIVGALLGIWHK